mmetsp:Transcript_39772/g.85755  ORF Transcript_39772/g.85755 Transcript_39772/m.85755 type:complete len:307 (+) Transcript_39772:255-1175(+)
MSITGYADTTVASVKPLNVDVDVNMAVAEHLACDNDEEKALTNVTDIAKLQFVHPLRTIGDDTERNDENDEGDRDDSVVSTDLSESTSFDIDVIEELSIPSLRSNIAPGFDTCEDVSSQDDDAHCPPPTSINFCPRMQSTSTYQYAPVVGIPNNNTMERGPSHDGTNHPPETNQLIKNVLKDFSSEGDQKILRAIARTATVNAAVLITATTGGAAGAVGYATGGAIAAKRLSDGILQNDEKEVTKSLAVYGCATGASIAGQAITGAVMTGVAGASLPLAGAVAFGVGCCSGIAAGALSEWTVDSVM